VVDGICLIFQARNFPYAHERTIRIGIVAAGDAEVNGSGGRNRRTVCECSRAAAEAIAIGLCD